MRAMHMASTVWCTQAFEKTYPLCAAVRLAAQGLAGFDEVVQAALTDR